MISSTKVLAKAADISKVAAGRTLECFIDAITDSLAKGDPVALVGFGTFETRARAARMGRNPRTKEEIQIAASTVPVFKAGKEFKDIVNK